MMSGDGAGGNGEIHSDKQEDVIDEMNSVVGAEETKVVEEENPTGGLAGIRNNYEGIVVMHSENKKDMDDMDDNEEKVEDETKDDVNVVGGGGEDEERKKKNITPGIPNVVENVVMHSVNKEKATTDPTAVDLVDPHVDATIDVTTQNGENVISTNHETTTTTTTTTGSFSF